MRRPSYNNTKTGSSTKSVGLNNNKSVRFAVSREGHVLTTESCEAKHSLDQTNWMNKEEWKAMRRSAQSVVDSVQKGDIIWSEARRHSYIKTMTKVWRSCVRGKELSESMKDELRFWTTIGHSRRGLEKHTLSEVQGERTRHRREHIEGIMFVQDQCWDNGLDEYQRARLLRVASEKLSKATKKFALILADADAHAFANDAEDTMAQDMVNKLSVKFSEKTGTPSPKGEPRSTKLVANAAA
jgi:hypothetical protein